MKKDLGDESGSFLRSYFDEAKKGLRINTLKTDLKTSKIITSGLGSVPWEEQGYYYGGSDTPGRSPLHSAGAYYIQEPSAMAPVAMLDVHPGMCVLDLCAAPGGKSTQIASYLNGKGLLISNEPVSDRATILSRNIERMGIKNAVVISHDPDFLCGRFAASFDRILVDAPCSGEGMFRKEPRALEEWSLENVSMCASRQERILDAAASMLKPGGRLVYSTCTFSKEENELQIKSFLESHPDYHPVDCAIPEGVRSQTVFETKPETASGSKPGTASPAGIFRIWPQDGGGEGHFFAVLRRDGELKADSYGYFGAQEPGLSNKQKQGIAPFIEFLSETVADGEIRDHLDSPKELFMLGKKLCLRPEGGLIMLSGCRVLRAGLELGEIKKDRFIPSHAFALALGPADVLRAAELSADGVMVTHYLNGQTISAGDLDNEASTGSMLTKNDPAAGDDGWILVTVSGISLGWAKASKGILKNHYPKGLRINYQ